MKFWNFYTLYLTCLVAFVILAVSCAGPRLERASKARYQAAYSAWCKLQHRTDISYEEWTVMRETKTLPTNNK